MTTVIPAVDGQSHIRDAEFVKLTLYNANNVPTVYTFSSSYKNETQGLTTYLALGGLLSVGAQQRDIRVTSFDTSISLSGIGAENIYAVLANKVKGSLIEIYRGFYDDNYILDEFVLRFNGVITSYSITEDFMSLDSNDTFTITINCSSYKTILQNRISGRQTSPNHWNEYENPPATKDSVMINVPNLINAYFNFGMPVTDQGK
jgi:hypothetical protein